MRHPESHIRRAVRVLDITAVRNLRKRGVGINTIARKLGIEISLF